MEYIIRTIVLGIVGIILTSRSVLFWVSSFHNKIALFENGPTAAFIMEQLLTLSYLVSVVFFFMGIMALFKAAFYAQRK